MHLSSTGWKLGKFQIVAIISILLLMPLLPMEADPIPADKEADLRSLIIRSSSNWIMDPIDGLELVDVEIEFNGEGIVGFSTGDTYEIIIDPTPGSPNIPWIALQVQIDGDILDVDIDRTLIRTTFRPSALLTIPRATTPWEEEEKWGEWNGDINYPDEPVKTESLGYRRINGDLLRSYSIWFTPFYLSSGSLEHSQDTEVEIIFTKTMAGPTPSRISGNPEDVPGTLSITSNMDVRPEYLIITREETVGELSVLAQWRNGMGIATSVVSVENIYAQYSGSEDNADLVRIYLKDVLDTWGTLQHVLLAGDWDTVPAKRVHDSDAYSGWDDGYIPADSYFQCLDGTWDLDGDGLYSEPGDMEDIIPDISVSRLAINDQRIWEEKVQQIIDYESIQTNDDWTSTALLIAANTHNYGDGSNHSEYLWGKYLDEVYNEKIPLYEDEGTLTLSDVDENLINGVSFVQFVDHGGPTVWCDDYGAGVVYRDRDARELTNSEMMPVISTLACLTTWFDDTSGCQYQRFSEGLGEAFTENTNGGALGYIGSSRTSVGILGANRYLPYDNGLQEDIARQIGGIKEFTLGSAFTDAKGHYAEVWGNQFSNNNNKEVSLCWLEFTLLGEPTVDIWTDQYGSLGVEVFHEDDLDPHIRIRILDENENPLPHANVTLQNFERGVFSRGLSDADGITTFDLELDWFCDINLTVTKHNYHTIRDYIRISDIIPPETAVMTKPDEPDGDNGWFLSVPVVSLVPNEKADVHYRIGTGDMGKMNSSMNFTLPPLEEGIHEVHFFGEDEAGNLEDEVHMTFRIDLHTPNVTSSIIPETPNGDNGWYGTEPLISLISRNEDKGAPVNIYYTLLEEQILYDGPFYVPEGIHSIPYFSVDEAGRTSNITYIEFMVDTTPPSTWAELSIEHPDGKNGWYVTGPVVELTSNENNARIEYRFSNRDRFMEYIEPFQVNDGNNILQFRSVDDSGNIGEIQSIPLKVDTTPPTVACKISPEEPDGNEDFYITSPTMRLDWHDNLGSTLYFCLDDGEWDTDVTRSDIGDGEHEVQFYAEDEAGNRCPLQKMAFKVDTTVPTTIVDVNDPTHEGWYDSQPLIQLMTDPDSDVHYWWEGKGEIHTYQRPLDVPGSEGIYRLHFYSIDRAGNEEYERVKIFNVDSKGPILRLDTMRQGRSGFLLDCTGSTDGTSLMFRVLEGSRVIVDWTSDKNIAITLPDGKHSLTIEAMDEGGNAVQTEIDVEVEPAYLPFVKIGVPIAVLLILIVILIIGVRKVRRKHEPVFYETENYHFADQRMEQVEIRE